MTKSIRLFILLICITLNAVAQHTLAIRQIGSAKDAMPELIFLDDQEQIPVRLNDSTIQFNVMPSGSECLFIGLDKSTRWFTRIWIDSTILHKELVIDYSGKTATIINGTEIDKVLEYVLIHDKSDERPEADSVAVKYIEQNPDQDFSLWLLSHGLHRDHPEKNAALLENLSPRLKRFPEYRQMKADLTDRKYPKYGDAFKEFTLTDSKEKPFHSTSVSNKIIILHFWSNNCAPCVKGMDALVNFHSTLDTSVIAFISVSTDKDKSIWKKASATNKIKWTNLWTEDNGYCDLCLNYNLAAMPYFVIFNKEKKITFFNDGEDLVLLKRKILEIEK